MRFTPFVLIVGTAVTLSSCGKINHMEDTTDQMAATTNHMSQTTDSMSKTTDHMSGTTDHMSGTTDNMAKTTDHMSTTTDKMSETTDNMSKTTDHMSETTDKMSTTTDHMSKTTDKMAVTTDHMNETTCTMYASLRQGNSKVSRDNDFPAIVNSKDLIEKLELAAKYMQGFEYQLWSPVCISIASRESVIEQGATELLTAIQPSIKDRSDVAATNQSANYETLYAIAATLHRTNDLQATLLSGTTELTMTVENILVQGLALDKQKNAGALKDAAYPTWAGIVGKYSKDAEFILRLRANFLMAYAFAIADSDSFGNSPGFWKKAWQVKVKNSKFGGWLFGSKWTPNLSNRTATEIQERITTSLNLAVATRNSLKELGTDPMTDKAMVKLWKSADFSSYNLAAMEKSGGASLSRAQAIRALIKARDLVIGN